jgi:hypothetical protein
MTLDGQRLADRIAISETIVRYFDSLDLRDWAAMRSTLAETIEVDFSELFGDPCATQASDDFVEFARQVLTGFDATQHISPNHTVTVDGDRAAAAAGMYAWHKLSEDGATRTFTLRGRYDIGMVRAGDGWRMESLHMHVWDEAGDKDVFAAARERFEAAEREVV